MSLDKALQVPFEEVVTDLIAVALVTAPRRVRGPSELAGLRYHRETGRTLEQDPRDAMRTRVLDQRTDGLDLE